jgi:hypothetical protein
MGRRGEFFESEEAVMTRPPAVDEFALRARAFVSWCDTSHADKPSELMQLEALRELAVVYAAGLALPDVEPQDAPDPPPMTSEKRQTISANLLSLPTQYYWEIFTPSNLDDKEPVCGDLFDDFQDIYSDLAGGLWLYDHGHVEAAVFSWRLMLGAHWGRHAVSAMHALHSYDGWDDDGNS